MQRTKVTIFCFIMLSIGVISSLQPCLAASEQPKLAQVVYLTTSKACGCLLDICQAGDKVMAEVFVEARLPLLERIDMARDKGTFGHYMKEYRLVTIPAVIFLDQGGNLLWKAAGTLNQDELLAKLKQFGA